MSVLVADCNDPSPCGAVHQHLGLLSLDLARPQETDARFLSPLDEVRNSIDCYQDRALVVLEHVSILLSPLYDLSETLHVVEVSPDHIGRSASHGCISRISLRLAKCRQSACVCVREACMFPT